MSLGIERNYNTNTDTSGLQSFSAAVAGTSSASQKHLLNSLEKIVSPLALKDPKVVRTISSAQPSNPPESYYEILGLQRLATDQDVKATFLRKVRILLKHSSNNGADLSLADKRELSTLCTARDILLDSRCRDEHDFRLLSLRLGQQRTSRTHLKVDSPMEDNSAEVIEALAFAELLEPAEVKLAMEMHQSSNQAQPFSEYLYRSQVIGREELESALLGRALVKSGVVGQEALKWVFKSRHFFGIDFIDSLLATIDINLEELTELARQMNLKMIAAKVANKSQKNEKLQAAIIS